MIEYKTNSPISVKQFIELLNKTTLGARRPLEDEKRVAAMLHHADLLITAWDGERLGGMARSVTDFAYCCYLSDLAVDEQYQKQGIYHFSNEGVCSWYDFAKEICELSGNSCDIQPCHSDEFPSKVKRPHFSVLDKTKLKLAFGVEIPYWKDSLVKCINELKENN